MRCSLYKAIAIDDTALLGGIALQSLGDRQLEFAGAILCPEREVPRGLVGPDGQPSARRFAVYRNNVVVGLCETLKANFPVVRRLVGDEFFTAMARAYVLDNPPSSPVMIQYGAGFAGFIGAFESAADIPYLRDVARLERAWMEAYCAAEAMPLGLGRLAQIQPNDLATTRFTLHPSVRIVRSSLPILSIWQTNVRDGTPTYIELTDNGQDVLVLRPAADVEVRLLPPSGAVFLLALHNGSPVLDAVRAAMASDSRFDLAANLAAIFASGVIVGFHTSKNSDDRNRLERM